MLHRILPHRAISISHIGIDTIIIEHIRPVKTSKIRTMRGLR